MFKNFFRRLWYICTLRWGKAYKLPYTLNDIEKIFILKISPKMFFSKKDIEKAVNKLIGKNQENVLVSLFGTNLSGYSNIKEGSIQFALNKFYDSNHALSVMLIVKDYSVLINNPYLTIIVHPLNLNYTLHEILYSDWYSGVIQNNLREILDTCRNKYGNKIAVECPDCEHRHWTKNSDDSCLSCDTFIGDVSGYKSLSDPDDLTDFKDIFNKINTLLKSRGKEPLKVEDVFKFYSDIKDNDINSVLYTI